MPGSEIALVGQHAEADLFTDGPLLVEAFDRLKVNSRIVAWGDSHDWASFDAVFVRAAYDYVERPQEFFEWAGAVEAVTQLANPAALMEWNGDKRYLRDLSEAGVPVIQTQWVEPDDALGDALDQIGQRDFVIKPAVSAGSRLAARYQPGERARAERHLARLADLGLLAMVQPYLSNVDRVGEDGIFVFAGEVSHAIRKSAALRLGGDAVEDNSVGYSQVVESRPVTSELATFAMNVVRSVSHDLPAPLYARVDALRDADGRLVLIELELIEPFLFLETSSGSADTFAIAAAKWLR